MFSTSMSSVYISLSLSNQGVYGCPFHVFSKSLFQLGSPLILVKAPELSGFSYSYFRMSWNIEAFSLCFYFYQNLWEVPHGKKGTGPELVKRPVYLRSLLRNNTNTVSTLVLLIHLFHVLYTRYIGITGRSRPPGEVGLTPRQYTEWNEVGRTCSTGDPSQQGLLPDVYRTASTGRCVNLHDGMLNKPMNYQQRTDPRSCARAVYIAGDTLRHQPMGAGHMTVL